MRYFVFTCENGFCGCDEDYPYMTEDDNITDEELWKIGDEILYNEYAFCEPDERFINVDDEEEEEDYYERLSYSFREVTSEEYQSYF